MARVTRNTVPAPEGPTVCQTRAGGQSSAWVRPLAAGGGRQDRAAHGKTPGTSATEPALPSGSNSGAGTRATLITFADAHDSGGTLSLAAFPQTAWPVTLDHRFSGCRI